MNDRAVAVGGPLMTRPYKLLLGLAVLGLVITIWRFAVGLGPVTGLSDGYPWGIWIAFDVVTGTAMACGGYAVALLLYILNKGKYHPLIRPAVLTSALGYSLAGLAIAIDVGRPWLMWRIPVSPFKWNLNSALLEVALCVMAYVVVLWIELSPAFLERWAETGRGTLGNLARKVNPIVEKSLLWIIALGILLPTMHQSSLGTVMLLAGPRLHPLWHTPLLPLLFLISCIAMGYGVVVIESAFSSQVFGRSAHRPMLVGLSKVMVWLLAVYGVLRVVDLVARGKLGLVFALDLYSLMFLLEIALVIGAVVMLGRLGPAPVLGGLVRTAMIIVLVGTLYRFDTYLLAFQPGSNWSYFPSVPEVLITVGVVAFELMLYIFIVKRFPILAGRAPGTRGSV
jgi:Ni/Fe-hydrogenase subunit HybB-like protein